MERPLRIALVRKEFSPVRGGAENYTAALAAELARRGHEVHLFVNEYDPSAGEPIIFHKVPMIRHPNVFKNYDFARNVEATLKWQSKNFDIICGLAKIWYQDVYRMSDPLFVHWRKVHPMSAIDSAFGFLNPRLRAQLHLEKKLFNPRNFRRIIAISALDSHLVRKHYKVPEECIRVIYNGVDHNRFNLSVRAEPRRKIRARYSIASSKFLMLFAAMDFKRKGLNFAIEALAHLNASETSQIVLMVVGRGDRWKYQVLAEELGVAGMIIWEDVVTNIEEYYGAADIFLCPTLYDPFANVHLEALACGLPIITTAMAGGAEVVRHGRTGYVLKRAEDSHVMAEYIVRMMQVAHRPALGEEASASVGGYTVEKNATETLDLYREIIEDKIRCRRPGYFRRG